MFIENNTALLGLKSNNIIIARFREKYATIYNNNYGIFRI